jgi:hypothetical protein
MRPEPSSVVAQLGQSNITYLTVDQFLGAITDAVGSRDSPETSVHPSIAFATPPILNTDLFAAAWFGISGADSPAAIAKGRGATT